jgi:hypothetical protein
MDDNQPIQSQTALFLYIPVSRLIFLSIFSLGLYQAYWIYRNWLYIRERYGLKIKPFWRGVFGLFYCHSILDSIYRDPEAHHAQLPTFPPKILATIWVILVIVARLCNLIPSLGFFDKLILPAFIPSFLCLVPVQKYINAVTEKQIPGYPFYRWSWGHFICVIPGVTICGFIALLFLAYYFHWK